MIFGINKFTQTNSKIFLFLLYLVFFIIPLISNSFLKNSFQTPKILSLELLIILLSSTVFSSIILRNKFKFVFNIIDLSVLFRLMLIFVLSFFAAKSDNSTFAFNVLLLLTIFYFLLRIIFSFNSNNTTKIILNISKIFLAVAITEVIIIVFNNHSVLFSLDNFLHSNKVLFKGTFGNPNWVSGFLVAVFPFLFLLVLKCKTKIFKYIYTAGTIIILLFVVLSQSRGAWLALFIGIFFYFLPSIQLFVKRNIRKKIFIIFFFTAILVLSIIALDKLYKMNSESANGRIFVWKITALMIADNPITGIGYGNYFYKFLDYQEKFFKKPDSEKYLSHAGVLRQSHNEYLQIFAETGLVGLSIFLIIIFLVFYDGIKLLKKTKQIENKIIRVSLTSTIIILAHSFVDTPLHNALPIYLLLFLNIAIISHFLSLRPKTYSNNFLSKYFLLNNSVVKLNNTFNLNNKTKLLLWGFAISLTLFFVNNTAQKTRAYYYWQKGINYVGNEQWNDAIITYKKAEKILPNKGEIKFNLGAAYLNIGQPGQAINYINTSLSSFKDKNTFISLGFAYLEISKFKEAEKAFNELTSKLPNLILPHLLLAKLYYDFEKYSDCEIEIKKVLEMEPKFDDSYARTIKEEARKLSELLIEKIN